MLFRKGRRDALFLCRTFPIFGCRFCSPFKFEFTALIIALKRFAPYTSLACIALSMLSLWGCAKDDDSLFGKSFHNFTSFFNAYYNARAEFAKGILSIRSTQTYGRLAKLEIFPSLESAASGKAQFDAVIVKTTSIVRYHPTGDLVDDALLLLGKAYYYNREFQPAERKFKEILTNYESGDVVDQATLWYGRTLAQQRSQTEAKEILGRVIESAKSDANTKGDAHYALAELAIGEEEYAEAIKQITLGNALTTDRDLQARATFTLARIHDLLSEYDKAAAAYFKVVELDPLYELRYAAQLNYAVDLREQKRVDESIATLLRMLDDDKNLEKFAEIRYELSVCYERQDRVGRAIDLYLEIIRRHPKTEQSARSYYRLGSIQQDINRKYASAKAFYDSSKTEFTTGDIFTLASQAAATMERIVTLQEAVAGLDSVIALGVTVKTVKDTVKVEVDSLQLANSVQRRTRREYRRSYTLAFGGTDAFGETEIKTQQTQKRVFTSATDTVMLRGFQKEGIDKKFAVGNFYHITLPIADSATKWYRQTLSEIALDRNRPLDARYLANTAELTLYSLADIYRALNDTAQVDTLYGQLLREYPRGKYSNRVRTYYNHPLLSLREQEPELSLYNDGFALLDDSRPQEAIDRFKIITATYPASPLVPKAMLAEGYAYEKFLSTPDSAVAAYKRLAVKFPQSAEAKSVSEKLAAVAEAASLAKAKRDSVAKADSLARSLERLKNLPPDSLKPAPKSGDAAPSKGSDVKNAPPKNASPPRQNGNAAQPPKPAAPDSSKPGASQVPPPQPSPVAPPPDSLKRNGDTSGAPLKPPN